MGINEFSVSRWQKNPITISIPAIELMIKVNMSDERTADITSVTVHSSTMAYTLITNSQGYALWTRRTHNSLLERKTTTSNVDERTQHGLAPVSPTLVNWV